MIFPEIYEKIYPGNYRAKIEEIDTTIKNGIYKVRIYPFMAELGIDFLPKANSTFTVRYKHVQLKVGDWVWVFFENQDCHFPVIFDLCNSKEEYPQPDFGTYGKYDKFEFGNFKIEIDEDNQKMQIEDGSGNDVDQIAIKKNIDDLQKKLDDLISLYNNHTHTVSPGIPVSTAGGPLAQTGATTGPGTATSTPSQETSLGTLTPASSKIKISKG